MNAKGIRVMVDESQGTAVVALFFDSEEDMKQADAALEAMDSGETPGTRASVRSLRGEGLDGRLSPHRPAPTPKFLPGVAKCYLR